MLLSTEKPREYDKEHSKEWRLVTTDPVQHHGLLGCETRLNFLSRFHFLVCSIPYHN